MFLKNSVCLNSQGLLAVLFIMFKISLLRYNDKRQSGNIAVLW